MLRYDSPNLLSHAVFAQSILLILFFAHFKNGYLGQILRYPADIFSFIPNFACSLCQTISENIGPQCMNDSTFICCYFTNKIWWTYWLQVYPLVNGMFKFKNLSICLNLKFILNCNKNSTTLHWCRFWPNYYLVYAKNFGNLRVKY